MHGNACMPVRTALPQRTGAHLAAAPPSDLHQCHRSRWRRQSAAQVIAWGLLPARWAPGGPGARQPHQGPLVAGLPGACQWCCCRSLLLPDPCCAEVGPAGSSCMPRYRWPHAEIWLARYARMWRAAPYVDSDASIMALCKQRCACMDKSGAPQTVNRRLQVD